MSPVEFFFRFGILALQLIAVAVLGRGRVQVQDPEQRGPALALVVAGERVDPVLSHLVLPASEGGAGREVVDGLVALGRGGGRWL